MTASTHRPSLLNSWRILGWGTIAALIALPAIAMQFTEEVNWTPGDFVFATVMLGGVGIAFELAVRASGSWAYRGAAAIALMAGLTILWVNGAVGIVGDEGNPLTSWFDLIPLVALAGAIGARFRARHMATAMFATAAAQLVVGAVVQFHGEFAWIATVAWMSLWVASGSLFLKASR